MPGSTAPCSTVAEVLDLTERRIQQLARDGVIPKAKRGQYDVVGAVHGYIRLLRDQVDNASKRPASLDEARVRLLTAQAEKEEREHRKAIGELVEVSPAAELFDTGVSAVAAHVRSFPTRYAPLIHGCKTVRQVAAKLKHACDEWLHELSRLEFSSPPDGAGAGPAKATAAPKRKRVGRPRKSAKPRGKRRARKVEH